MTQIMTPSMTAGQIDKAVANYRALLEKHSREFNADSVQTVLGQSEFAEEQFAVFLRRVEAIQNTVVRKVSVNRNRSPQEALSATNRDQFTDEKIVDAMPGGGDDKVEVVFFKPDLWNQGGLISDDDLEKEFDLRDLKPADPISVAAVNEAYPAFADEKPHGTHWKDAQGNWCHATFSWNGEREVRVECEVGDWGDHWWFAGVRK